MTGEPLAGPGPVQHTLQSGATTMAAALLLATPPSDRALAGWQPRQAVAELCTPAGPAGPRSQAGSTGEGAAR
ncbi:MAG TPA: hypothetical protein VGM53_35465 [Streptosporangiaceae bacterium]|jgi:hypothetical protein